ncbi:MAG: ABC transporter ATP-binding protein [Thermoleophilia bacterium]
MGRKPPTGDASPPGRGASRKAIEAAALVKEYGTTLKTRALRGVDLSIDAGEFMAIIGQSGSGKSTLLNILGLLDRPTGGSLYLLGQNMHTLDRKGLAAFRNEHLGFVFQFHHLLPEFSVRENLMMPAWIAGSGEHASSPDRIDEVLDILGLGDVTEKGADALSGGQKQRVAIGRALVNSPDIVLADEPTGNLDSANSAQVYALFRRVSREWGTTFLIVTHDRGIAQQTDRIVEIRDGLVEQDVRNEYLPTEAGAR